VLFDWTAARMLAGPSGALHHLDIRVGAWIYRVFLLPQYAARSIWRSFRDEFRALAPSPAGS